MDSPPQISPHILSLLQEVLRSQKRCLHELSSLNHKLSSLNYDLAPVTYTQPSQWESHSPFNHQPPSHYHPPPPLHHLSHYSTPETFTPQSSLPPLHASFTNTDSPPWSSPTSFNQPPTLFSSDLSLHSHYHHYQSPSPTPTSSLCVPLVSLNQTVIKGETIETLQKSLGKEKDFIIDTGINSSVTVDLSETTEQLTTLTTESVDLMALGDVASAELVNKTFATPAMVVGKETEQVLKEEGDNSVITDSTSESGASKPFVADSPNFSPSQRCSVPHPPLPPPKPPDRVSLPLPPLPPKPPYPSLSSDTEPQPNPISLSDLTPQQIPPTIAKPTLSLSDAHRVLDEMTHSGNLYFYLVIGSFQFKLWDPGARKEPTCAFSTGNHLELEPDYRVTATTMVDSSENQIVTSVLSLHISLTHASASCSYWLFSRGVPNHLSANRGNGVTRVYLKSYSHESVFVCDVIFIEDNLEAMTNQLNSEMNIFNASEHIISFVIVGWLHGIFILNGMIFPILKLYEGSLTSKRVQFEGGWILFNDILNDWKAQIVGGLLIKIKSKQFIQQKNERVFHANYANYDGFNGRDVVCFVISSTIHDSIFSHFNMLYWVLEPHSKKASGHGNFGTTTIHYTIDKEFEAWKLLFVWKQLAGMSHTLSNVEVTMSHTYCCKIDIHKIEVVSTIPEMLNPTHCTHMILNSANMVICMKVGQCEKILRMGYMLEFDPPKLLRIQPIIFDFIRQGLQRNFEGAHQWDSGGNFLVFKVTNCSQLKQSDLGGYLDVCTVLNSPQLKQWDPGDQILVFTIAWSCQFKQWDPGKSVIISIFLQP